MSIRRWHSWAALAGLMGLTMGTAAWSVTTAPGVTAARAVAPARHSDRAASVTVATTSTTTTTPREEYFLTPAGDDAGGAVGPDGRWTATGTVPMVPPGPATVTGWCMPQEGDDGSSIEFDYIPGLRVMVTTPYRLAVERGTTVNAGTAVDVNLLGGTCQGVSGPEVDLYTGAQIKVVTATASSVSGWQFALALPPGLMPGQYRLEADCVYSRGAVEGSYAPVTITIR